MSADTRFELFDERIFCTGFKKPPPLFVTQCSKENVYEDQCFDEVDCPIPQSFNAHSKGNTVQIADDVMKTCDTILIGFEKITTANILMNGEILCDPYVNTKNAKEIQASLEINSQLWKGKSTNEAIHLNQLDGLLKAIENQNFDEILKIYYRAQHQHTFNADDRLYYAPVHIDESSLNPKWVQHIKDAITSISIAAPGINIFEDNANNAIIYIGALEDKLANLACTFGHINQKTGTKPFIHLGRDWDTKKMKGTVLHELMHALNFSHEMQRFDIHMYLDIEGQDNNNNYTIKADKVLTRFDPYSVMMYNENHEMKRKEGDKIWKQKPKLDRHDELSELNKVALNLKFKPCLNTLRQDMVYDPKLNEKMQMIYCGRKVMLQHNQVGDATTDGYCGPHNWANCASCRVIRLYKPERKEPSKIKKLNKCLEDGRWQGLSGLFYCGKQDDRFKTDLKNITSDGVCGPDNGIPCTECGKMLFENYSIARWNNILYPTF